MDFGIYGWLMCFNVEELEIIENEKFWEWMSCAALCVVLIVL